MSSTRSIMISRPRCAVGQRRGQHAPQRRILFQRLDDLGIDLVALGELGHLLDELFGQHAFALQRPESFENNTDRRDRADDDRPHEWAAGPHDFPHGPGSYRSARESVIQAPPGEGIARRARHAQASCTPYVPKPISMPPSRACRGPARPLRASARASGAGLAAPRYRRSRWPIPRRWLLSTRARIRANSPAGP